MLYKRPLNSSSQVKIQRDGSEWVASCYDHILWARMELLWLETTVRLHCFKVAFGLTFLREDLIVMTYEEHTLCCLCTLLPLWRIPMKCLEHKHSELSNHMKTFLFFKPKWVPLSQRLSLVTQLAYVNKRFETTLSTSKFCCLIIYIFIYVYMETCSFWFDNMNRLIKYRVQFYFRLNIVL